MLRLWMAIASVTLLAAGCADISGSTASMRWNKSVTQCLNGVCTYATNHDDLSAKVRCGSDTILNWTVEQWVHGSISVVVSDPAGTTKDERTHAGNGQGTGRFQARPASGASTARPMTPTDRLRSASRARKGFRNNARTRAPARGATRASVPTNFNNRRPQIGL